MNDASSEEMHHATDLQRVVNFYESITLKSIPQLDRIYTSSAFFKDPFNEVNGLPAISEIFTHMFRKVDAPRFVVTTQIVQGDVAFITWDFLFRMKRSPGIEQCIRGATHLRFESSGLVCFHRDYWDAAEELYEKLPALGTLMRVLKRAARK